MPAKRSPPDAIEPAQALTLLKNAASPAHRAGLARYGIPDTHALGVPMREIQALGKRIGRRHAMAQPLWDSGIYEARLLVAFIADPARLTPTQMDRWCRQFDTWAVCDTLCLHLFDRSPHAWGRIDAWACRRGEFEKRAAFALLAGLAVHDRHTPDAPFLAGLAHVDAAAGDARNFVSKGVSWALRAIGHRNAALHAEAMLLAKRLAASDDTTRRWVGKDALRDLD
ncbi:MAG TPA: DNA alkylation repair protein, partial [Pseudoxanthomonas sp.]|nr:DNA alkylation repair protein [Pseudoxanthomonas sp.]